MAERVLMKGNEAIAEAAIRAGCRHFFGYPITPQTEVSAYMSKRMPKVGGCFLQAESELAAVNMVLGAAAAGVRAMTASSSPGISLKSEGISYLVGSDLPCVILNIQRGGPGLGGIQPGQADYNQATKAPGHGDMHLPIFAPCTVQEMVDSIFKMFDIADKYRTPTMLLGDGLLGQMMEPVSFPEVEVHTVEKPWAACGHGDRRPKNIVNSLYLQPDMLEKTNLERFERYAQIEATEALCECVETDDAELLVVAYGAAARIARSAVMSARGQGIKAGMFRPVTLWPFPKKELNEAAKAAKNILVVELSMGQMVRDIELYTRCRLPVHFYGRCGGMIPTPAEVLAEMKRHAGGDR